MDDRIELILKEVKSNDSVLDIGCVNHDLDTIESGKWLHKYLYTKSKKVVGIDTLSNEINKLKKSGYNVLLGDAEKFNFNQKFNVIVAGELIEHLSNPGNFLDNCKKHLKNNGKLLLTTPNVWCIINQASIFFRGFAPLHEQHKCWYDKQTLNQLLLNHGFKIDNIEYIQTPTRARGWILSYPFYVVGLKQIGGSTIFIKCSINDENEIK